MDGKEKKKVMGYGMGLTGIGIGLVYPEHENHRILDPLINYIILAYNLWGLICCVVDELEC